ncbi:MAG: hypothetical protein GQ525_07885, partial [Draconibacterium sp.]|nr:hypothetical protein [Draconibacterium sp.]
MKKFGKYTLTLLLVIAGAFIAVWTYSTYFDKPNVITIKEEQSLKYAAISNDGENALTD